MAKMYYEKDCDLSVLNGKKIAVIGYGSQGHAHAQNLQRFRLRCRRRSASRASPGTRQPRTASPSMSVADATKAADIIMILVNDERAADIYKEHIETQPVRRQGHCICPWLQHPLQADRTPRRRGRVHGCSQGPRPHRSRPVCRTARAFPAWLQSSRMPPATVCRSLWLTSPASAAPVPVSWRPPCMTRPRPTCSASRPFCAAV